MFGDTSSLKLVIDAENRASKVLKDVQSQLEGVAQRTQKLGKDMANVGKELSMKVTAPIVGMGVASFKMSSDFQTSMDRIVGLVGVARNEVNGWKDDIFNLSRVTGKTAIELGDAMFFITSAGLRGGDAISVLKMSAKAAAAGLGETKTVADLVTSAINAYGIKNLSAANATDVLVAAVREGKAEAPELAASMGQVLPIASELGVSFDQVGGTIAAMTRTGTNAATAAIQLRQILASLLKPSKQASDTLEEFGTSAGEVREKIREEGLLTTLDDLKNRFGDNEEAASMVFGNIRALSGVLDLLGENSEENIALLDRMSDSTGALEKAFEDTENQGRAWGKMVAEGQILLIQFGDTVAKVILPVFEKLREILVKVSDWWSILSESQKQTILIILGIVAVIGPLLVILGNLIWVVGLAMQGFTLLAGAFSLLGVVIFAIIITIGLLIKIGWDLYHHWDEIVEGFKIIFNEWLDKVKGVLNSIKQYFTDTWEGIKIIVGDAVDWLMKKLQPLINAFQRVTKFASKLRSKVGGAISTVREAIPFQYGGIITRPTLGLVGEAGPEAVIPLNRMAGAGIGGITINVYGDISGNDLIEKVGEGILRKLQIRQRI